MYYKILVPTYLLTSFSKVLGSRKYRNFSNEQLVKAVEAVRSGLSLRKAEKQFGIPRCSINRAIKEECRRKETDGLRKQTKNKLNVPAGRGIYEKDIVILEDNPKQEKKTRKQLVEDQTVINKRKLSKKRQKTRKVLESSESDEGSCNDVVLDDSSDDDWDFEQNRL
ncbi:hypothetical protein JTB14_008993 [Gonioctena quinquepunctata]|nr:hypothetical protein JTB14_008993 [Gonioctena quinquepunctata]